MNSNYIQRSKLRGGLTFTAKEFSNIESIPLPPSVNIKTDTRASINVVVGDRVLCGQAITKSDPEIVSSHATVSGVIKNISNNIVTIKSDGLDKPLNHIKPSVHSSRELQTMCRHMGLVGLGGAGFAVHRKIQSVETEYSCKIDTLLINAAECDPAIYCDEALMQERAQDVACGVDYLANTLNTTRCIVGIEKNKKLAIEQLKKYLSAKVEIVCVPAIYPSGAENTLFTLCTGINGSLKENRAICFNISTCHAIHKAVTFSQPLISRIVTLTTKDMIKNIELRIGTPVTDLMKHFEIPTSSTIVCGGQMMGSVVGPDHCIDKRTNSLIFKHDDTKAPAPCIKCGACEEVCPENLYPQQLFWHSRTYNSPALTDLHLQNCTECGCCDAVCPSHIRLASQFNTAKQTMRLEREEIGKADLAKQRYIQKLARLDSQSSKQRKQLTTRTAALKSPDKKALEKKALIEGALKRSKNKKSAGNKGNDDPSGLL